MNVTICLVGTVPGQPAQQKFSLSSGDGKNIDDMQTVFEYIRRHTTVQGLRFGLSGGGLITFEADASQLRPEVVADVRRVVEAALRQI